MSCKTLVRGVFSLIVLLSHIHCSPSIVWGQNIQATFNPTTSLLPFWVLDPDQFDGELSNWDLEDYTYPHNFNPFGSYFDATINDGSGVLLQPILPIAISNLEVTNGSSLTLLDGADFLIQDTGNSGEVFVETQIFMENSGGALSTEFFLDGDTRFFGGGELLMSNSAGNAIRGNSAFNDFARMTLEDFSVYGAGNLGSNEVELVVLAGNVVRATESTRLIIDPTNDGIGVTNQGLLQAGEGTLRLFDGTFDNRFGTIDSLSGQQVELANATVIGGTFSSSGSGSVVALGGVSLVGTVTNTGHFRIPTVNVVLSGNLSNQNQISIGEGTDGGGLLYDLDTQLDGGGTIQLSNSNGNQINATFGSTGRLTNVDNTIVGSGTLGGRITNHGTITANQSTPLIFQTQDIVGGGQNRGLMQADNGGVLQFHISTLDNAGGLVQANPNGILRLTGSATIEGGNVNLIGASELQLAEGTVDASLNNSSQGTISTTQGNSNFLLGTVNNPDGGIIRVNDDTRLNLVQGSAYNNAGTIELDGQGALAGFGGTRLMIDGNVTLQGGGTVSLSNSVSNTIEAGVGSFSDDVLINADHKIHGSGNLGRNTLELVNQAIIEADQSRIDDEAFGTISIDPGGPGTSGQMTNQGIVRASHGGRVELLNGLYENAGGVFEATDGSQIELREAATIRNGTVRTSGTGELRVTRQATLTGDVELDANTIVDGIGRLNVAGNLTNRKTIAANATGIHLQNEVRLDGGGSLVLADDPNSTLTVFSSSNSDRLVNVDNTISGAGRILFLGITNQGTIRADGENALVYQIPGGGFDNQGNLQVVGNGGMDLIGGSFLNQGTVEIAAGSRLFRDGNYQQTSGHTRVDGTLEVSFGNSIQILGGSLSGNGQLLGNLNLSGGKIAPGNSTGILYLENAATIDGIFELEIRGNFVDGVVPEASLVNTGTDPLEIGFDQLNVFDRLTIQDDLTFQIQLEGGFRPQVGDFFDVITADEIILIGELDWTISNAPGYEFEFDVLNQFDNLAGFNRDVVRFTVTAVPEPGALAVTGSFMLAVLMTRRRRSILAVNG